MSKMTLEKMIDLLVGDLHNEYKHLLFYLRYIPLVGGLHALEVKELLQTEAQGELEHVQEFSDLIVGLGRTPHIDFTKITLPIWWGTNANEIIKLALEMEDEVVENYSDRIEDVQRLGGAHGRWIEVFLEDQIADSRKDADKLRRLLVKE